MGVDRWSAQADRLSRIVLSVVGLGAVAFLLLAWWTASALSAWGQCVLAGVAMACLWTAWLASPKVREELVCLLPWISPR